MNKSFVSFDEMIVAERRHRYSDEHELNRVASYFTLLNDQMMDMEEIKEHFFLERGEHLFTQMYRS